jgi:hypothetical protein
LWSLPEQEAQGMVSPLTLFVALCVVTLASGHGMMVNPRPRNSIDHVVNVNDKGNACSNVTGDKCTNGQAALWYSQGILAFLLFVARLIFISLLKDALLVVAHATTRVAAAKRICVALA